MRTSSFFSSSSLASFYIFLILPEALAPYTVISRSPRPYSNLKLTGIRGDVGYQGRGCGRGPRSFHHWKWGRVSKRYQPRRGGYSRLLEGAICRVQFQVNTVPSFCVLCCMRRLQLLQATHVLCVCFKGIVGSVCGSACVTNVQ